MGRIEGNLFRGGERSRQLCLNMMGWTAPY